MTTFQELQQAIRDFAKARDWEKFHSPKNLAMALSVETAELLEHFQWQTEAESAEMSPKKLDAVADEIADVQIYLMRLADRLDVDVLAAVTSKLKSNETKYPADRVRGSAKKYTEYDDRSTEER